jgi:methylmalonyl-CoA carboxyltransferase large subunit
LDNSDTSTVVAAIEALRLELRCLVGRVAELETRQAGGNSAPAAAAADGAHGAAAAAQAAAAPAAPARSEATEEDLLVIAAAVAAFLGVRAQVRQVRLIQSAAWAQVGRATVHASHRVH